jgi:hypothetical protein
LGGRGGGRGCARRPAKRGGAPGAASGRRRKEGANALRLAAEGMFIAFIPELLAWLGGRGVQMGQKSRRSCVGGRSTGPGGFEEPRSNTHCLIAQLCQAAPHSTISSSHGQAQPRIPQPVPATPSVRAPQQQTGIMTAKWAGVCLGACGACGHRVGGRAAIAVCSRSTRGRWARCPGARSPHRAYVAPRISLRRLTGAAWARHATPRPGLVRRAAPLHR